MSAEVNSLVYTNTTQSGEPFKTWHGLGTPVEYGTRPDTAFGLLPQVEYRLGQAGSYLDGVFYPSSDNALFAVVNNAPSLLKTGVKRVTPVQPSIFQQIANILADAGHAFMGVGFLSNYNVMFLQLAMPDFYVANRPEERHTVHFLIGQDFRAPKAVQLGEVFKRVQCQNTWRMAQSEGLSSLPHTTIVGDLAVLAAQIQAGMVATVKKEQDFLNALFKAPKIDLNAGLEFVYPDVQKPKTLQIVDRAQELNIVAPNSDGFGITTATSYTNYQSALARTETLRTEAARLTVQYADETGGGLAYGFFQAVTHLAQHGGNGYAVRGDDSDKYVSIAMGGASSLPIARARQWLGS